MVFRSGKYQGYTVQEVAYSDPSYLQWVRINRPEMLIERKAKPKAQKIEVSEEELEERSAYKNITPGSWEDAF
jgi:hypothetical protein